MVDGEKYEFIMSFSYLGDILDGDVERQKEKLRIKKAGWS